MKFSAPRVSCLRLRRVAPVVVSLLTFTAGCPPATAHLDKVEDRLLLHFATGGHPIENRAWPDLTHRVSAQVQGEPSLTGLGPAQALTFNGFTDWLLSLIHISEPTRPY